MEKATACVHQCQLDEQTNKCDGCNRPITAIRRWRTMREDERKRVLLGVWQPGNNGNQSKEAL